MERNLAFEFVRATEEAALACSHLVGRGDKKLADQKAVEALRKRLNTLDIKGEIVIGEGERDEAPMLYIGEKLGKGRGPRVTLAVDPLEGTNLVAHGLPNALSVVAAAVEGDGKLISAPDVYMNKLAVPIEASGKLNLKAPISENLKATAKALKKSVKDLMVVVLDRPRHLELIEQIRKVGSRIKLISDGDVEPVIEIANPDSGIDVLAGIGGAPEGVLAAAAARCLGVEFLGQFVFKDETEQKRGKKHGISPSKIYQAEELARGNVLFCATWVTGERGVRYIPGKAVTQSVVMRSKSGTVRYITAYHRHSD